MSSASPAQAASSEQPAALAQAASPEQAAAITAAVERFMRATAPLPAQSDERPDPWVRAAILEGVTRADPELFFPALG